jgi:hypothetical protein
MGYVIAVRANAMQASHFTKDRRSPGNFTTLRQLNGGEFVKPSTHQIALCSAFAIASLASLACDESLRSARPSPFPSLDAGLSPASMATAGTAGSGNGASGAAAGAAATPAAGRGAPRPPTPAVGPSPAPPMVVSACFPCGAGCEECGQGCVCGPLPEPQPWQPPVDPVGEPGFRQSDEPFCPPSMFVFGSKVWSDERGVYVVVSGDRSAFNFQRPPATDRSEDDAGITASPQATLGGTTTFAPDAITQLWRNDGRQWTLDLEVRNAASDFGLRGASGSWLALYDKRTADVTAMNFTGAPPLITSCSLGVLQNDALECIDLDPVADLFVANARLAHALVGDTRLLSYDGERWRAMTELLPFPASVLWADESRVLALGRVGTALWLENGAWTFQDAGTVEHFTAAWGTARDNIWAGTAQGGVFHYDGATWSERGRIQGDTCDARSPVGGIWGIGTQVYFQTASALARWNGTEIETVANWSCSPSASSVQITGLWGNAPDELFLSLVDQRRFDVDRCAPVFVVHYDGTTFHRM